MILGREAIVATTDQVAALYAAPTDIVAPSDYGLTNYQSDAFTQFCERLYRPEDRVRLRVAPFSEGESDQVWWCQRGNYTCVAMSLFQILLHRGVLPSEALAQRLFTEAKNDTDSYGEYKGRGIMLSHLGALYSQFSESKVIPLERLQEGVEYYSTAHMNTIESRIAGRRYEKITANTITFRQIIASGKGIILSVDQRIYDPPKYPNQAINPHAILITKCWVNNDGYGYVEVVDSGRGVFSMPIEIISNAIVEDSIAYIG